MAITSNEINKTASFRIYPSNLITYDFTNVKIISIGGWESVPFIKAAELHANVYPMLPAGTPNDYRAYSYITVRLPNGDITAVGAPWIDESSIRISSNTDIVITIRGKSTDDIPLLRKVLAVQGFTDIDITTQAKA